MTNLLFVSNVAFGVQTTQQQGFKIGIAEKLIQAMPVLFWDGIVLSSKFHLRCSPRTIDGDKCCIETLLTAGFAGYFPYEKKAMFTNDFVTLVVAMSSQLSQLSHCNSCVLRKDGSRVKGQHHQS